VDLAADLPVKPRSPAPTGRDGHTFAWTFGDLAGLWYAIDQGQITHADALIELGRITRTAVLADVHITWSWRDPAPTIATYWRSLTVASLRLTAAQGKPATGSWRDQNMICGHELGGRDHEMKRAPGPAVAGDVAPNQRDIGSPTSPRRGRVEDFVRQFHRSRRHHRT
jgi:hypothetical protein